MQVLGGAESEGFVPTESGRIPFEVYTLSRDRGGDSIQPLVES
jgi:hypothetical protein